MTPSQLKYNYENKKNGYFFTRDTMKFFGDTMKNYGVRTHDDCYELYRKSPVKHGIIDSAYFDKITFDRMYNK